MKIRLRLLTILGFIWASMFANVMVCSTWLSLQKAIVSESLGHTSIDIDDYESILVDLASEDERNGTSVSSGMEEEEEHIDSPFSLPVLQKQIKTQYQSAFIKSTYSDIVLPPPELA